MAGQGLVILIGLGLAAFALSKSGARVTFTPNPITAQTTSVTTTLDKFKPFEVVQISLIYPVIPGVTPTPTPFGTVDGNGHFQTSHPVYPIATITHITYGFTGNMGSRTEATLNIR